MDMLYKSLAEMGGTFALIFVGGASIILSEKNVVPPMCVPLAWGCIVFLMIIAVGRVSGAHFNPVVTLAFAIASRIPPGQIWFYWASQMLGGVAAVSLLGVLKK